MMRDNHPFRRKGTEHPAAKLTPAERRAIKEYNTIYKRALANDAP